RLHLLLIHFSFHPLPQLFHNRTALSLVIFQSPLRTHFFSRFFVLIDLPDLFQHIAAFIRIKRSDLPKLPPRMRQADRLYSFLLPAPVRRERSRVGRQRVTSQHFSNGPPPNDA